MRSLHRNDSSKVLLTIASIFCGLMFLIPISTMGQSINKAEYFFDTDPGQGNGTAISFTPTGGSVSFTTSISTASLSEGFHQLAIRAKETGGVWSIFESRGFYISSAATTATNIIAAEYFLDSDPGNGNGTPIAVSAGATVNFVVSIPTTSLSPGFHFLAIRTKGLGGKWGLFEARGFYITSSTANVANINKAEYFFDTDPGNGNGTPISVTPGATTNFTVSLPATGLQPGFHFLAVRTKDANGKWGIFESRGFYITGSTADASNITKAEYFFDVDPGQGNGIAIPITAGATSNFTATIPVTGLTTGFHFLSIRIKGSDGRWGVFESRGFYVSPIVASVGDIVKAEYFIDTDPGEDNGIAITVNPTGPTINQTFPIAITGVTSGAHKLGIRVKDANGLWSAVQMENFTVLTCTPPVAPTAPPVSRCNSGTVTINATGAGSGQVYRWYADATTSAVAATGSSFTTPSLTVTTDYFVSVFDPVTLCESPRTQISATITTTSKPILNASGNISLCEGASFLLSAPAGFSSYTWTNGATTQQILIASNGTFSVVTGNGSCNSLPSDPITFTFATKPAKPVVVASGPTNLCDGGTVTLSAPAGFAAYEWSSGETTPSITKNISGNYSVIVGNATGCKSSASSETIVTSSTSPAKPIIVNTGLTLCGTGASVKLSAPVGFSGYTWSTGETTREILVTTSGDITVTVSNTGGCQSPVSDVTSVVESTVLSLPVITTSGSACDGGSVTLTAPSGFSSYEWSSGETTQSISKNVSGNYSVVVGNATGCKSPPSLEAVIKTSTSPTKPTVEVTGSTTLCIDAFSVLSAPSGFTHYEWSGGETSQSLVVKKAGTYSVKVANDLACYSPLSNAVQITESGQPCSTNNPTNPTNPNNRPPEIKSTSITSAIEGKVTVNLLTLLSDDDGADDIVPTSLRIVGQPASGAIASIDAEFNLVLDYNKIAFSGIEYVTIQVCDRSGSCTQQELEIEVAGDVVAYTAVSPNGDGKNEVLYLEYIDIIPDTKDNLVTIYNRWGNVVFDMANYDNDSKVFKGFDKNGKELPNDNYFYKIVFGSGKKSKTGFITLRR